MADQTVVTDLKTPAEIPLIEEIRGKSFNQILQEQEEERNASPVDDKPTEPTDEEKKKEEETRLAKEAQDAEEKVKQEEEAKKRDVEIAAKAAQNVLDKQKEEDDAKAAKVKDEEEEAKRQEALKPKFTGKDKDGNVVPKDYDELAAESARVAEEKALERLRAEQAAKDKQAEDEKERTKQTEKQQADDKKAYEDQLQKELDADLTAIYTAGDLPKIADPKNESDLGNREFKNLMETAQRVNMDRLQKGLPLIRSLQVIRYGKDDTGQSYYKPLETKPPGHDAPVLNSESPLSHDLPDDKYIPSRDRQKSMAQLIREETQKRLKALNVRGK